MANDDAEDERPYVCVTQPDDELLIWGFEEDSSGPPAINVGKEVPGFGHIVPRWNVSGGNTVLQYSVNYSSFQALAAGEADFAANELQEAADEWNSLGLGVTISRTPLRDDANFVLVFQQNQGQRVGRRFAEAFFPHEPLNRYLIVTDLALDPSFRGVLKNILLHELGHVLGLRHEFALDPQQQLQLGVQEDADGAVQFQGRNPMSVMNYNYNPWPMIQDSDKVAVKAFYQFNHGDLIPNSNSSVYLFPAQVLP